MLLIKKRIKMKSLLKVILVWIFSSSAFAGIKALQINNSIFEVKQTHSETEEGFEQDNIELYRNGKKLLAHTKRLSTGECSILTIEVGDYEVKNNQLIFYTYWAAGDRQGLWAYPYGVRKQVYSVSNSGAVKPVSAEVYIEDVIGNPLESNPQQDYLQFLAVQPQIQKDKMALNNYIKIMQKRYKARFVSGVERKQLITEVKMKLAQQIADETKGWKEDFGSNLRM